MDKSKLKLLMKKGLQEKQQAATTKINSPLIQINSTGQMICKLCKVEIKTEALWTAHCATKKHKDALESLKEAHKTQKDKQTMPPPSLTATTKKRAADDQISSKEAQPQNGKKSKTDNLPPGFFDSESSPSKPPSTPTTSKPTTISSPSVPTSTTSEIIAKAPVRQERAVAPVVVEQQIETTIVSKADVSGLPAGFFDVSERQEKVIEDYNKTQTTATQIVATTEKIDIGKELELFQASIDPDLKKMDELPDDVQDTMIHKQVDMLEEEENKVRSQKLSSIKEKALQLKLVKEQMRQKRMEQKKKKEDEAQQLDDSDFMLDWRGKAPY